MMSSGATRRQASAPSPLPPDVRERLESVEENISLLSKQIREGTSVPHCEALTPPDVVAKLCQCARGVADSCTKLTVLFSKSPSPSATECGVVCVKVEQSLLHLVSALYQLPQDQGRTLQKEAKDAVLRVLGGVENFLLAVINKGCSGNGVKLQGTGTVWESCDTVIKVSKDNRAAVLRVFISQLHLLKDAASEVQELRSDNGLSDDLLDDEDELDDLSEAVGGMHLEGAPLDDGEDKAREWTLAERELVEPCITLVQLSADITGAVSRLLVSHGSVQQLQFIEELDNSADIVQKLSPLVDDLAHELPGPVAWEKCQDMGQALGKALQLFLETVSHYHFCVTSGNKWESGKFEQTVQEALARIVPPSHTQ